MSHSPTFHSIANFCSYPVSQKHICICNSLIHIIGVLFQDIHGQLWEEEVVREEVEDEEEKKETTQVYFINRKIKYFWDDSTCTFVKLRLVYYSTVYESKNCFKIMCDFGYNLIF